MPLLVESLVNCQTATQVIEIIFVDNAVAVFDVHHRHLIKCWLSKHFITAGHQHSVCLGIFEDRLCNLIDDACNPSDTNDAKWHLRFVNGFQLVAECDVPVRCLLKSSRCTQKIADYFAFAINKFTSDTFVKSSSGLVYLEAKLLLKSVQVFSRIFGKIPNGNRQVHVPDKLNEALWTLAANDVYELDVRQASTNLIFQLDHSPSYDKYRQHSACLIETKIAPEKQASAKLCLQVLGVGAFCSQLPAQQLAGGRMQDGRPLLLVLLEDIAACCSSRMSTSFAIAFYRSLLCWTKAAVSTCLVRVTPKLWNAANLAPVFRLFVQLIESGWDSQAEVVRDLVSEVFESLLELFRHNSSNSNNDQDTFLDELVCTLLKTDWQSRLKYRPLSQIVDLFGPDLLFESASRVGIIIPEKLSLAFSDRAIATHAATFIAAIVKSSVCRSTSLYFDEESFLQRLLASVVKAAHHDGGVTRHFVSFAVPKLLKARGKRFVTAVIHRAASAASTIPNATAKPLDDAEFMILFSVCRSARAAGLYDLDESDSEMPLLLNEALNHSNIYIRLEAFGFLCENARIGQPLIHWELDAIERFVVAAFKVDSSDFRQAYCSLFRKLLTRLRDGGNGAERQENGSSLVESYTAFLDRIIGLCLEGLAFNGAAFARRSTALTILALIGKVFPDTGSDIVAWFTFSNCCFIKRAPTAVQILLRALMRDTYEDNKKIAFDLLTSWWQRHELKEENIFAEALRLSQSTHSQDGVTAAYLFKLLCIRHKDADKTVEFLSMCLLKSLKDQLEVARGDLAKAATSRPMYSTILTIRYVIAEFRDRLITVCPNFRSFAVNMIKVLRDVAEVVTPVISHQSPEGLQLENEGDNGDDLEGGVGEDNDPLGLLPEFLTVCCWRSIKEASLTMSLLVDIAVDQEALMLLNLNEITQIGCFFSEMLLKARHRGAFEIAYAGFDHICARLWRCQSTELNILPSTWLKPLLACFESTGENVSLSSTRRSAGLPFYFQAVVGNEPRLTRSVSVSLLENVLALLLARAQKLDSDDIVRVHALNILRALVRDSRLEQAITPFLGEAYISAMMALSSKQWMLRNSGTLLFSALMNRVFGVHREKFSPAKKNSMTGRLFFALYPNLFQFLLNFFSTDKLNLQDKENTTSSVAVTFLCLFEHLYPSPFDVNESVENRVENDDHETVRAPSSPQINVFAFIPALISLLGHRSVRVRLMASRSIRNFVTVDSLPVLLEKVINCYNDLQNWDANFVEGCLILFRKLVIMFATDAEVFQLILDVSMTLWEAVSPFKNDFVTASMLHLIIKLTEYRPRHDNFPSISQLIDTGKLLSSEVISGAKAPRKSTPFPSTLLIRATQCAVLCLLHSKDNVASFGPSVEGFLTHSNKFVRSTAADCLNELFLGSFLKKEGYDSLLASLFDNSLGKDEEYISLEFGEVYVDKLLNVSNLLHLVWRQISSITLTENEFEVSKLLTLFSFCVLSLDDGVPVVMTGTIAEEAYEKIIAVMTQFGHFSELAVPCNRALAAIAPYLSLKSQNVVVDVLSKIVSSCDDFAKYRIAIFGLSRLPKECVLLNDAACDVMLTLLTSSEPDIRILASWYITRKLCLNEPFEYHSLHSGQALVVFICLVTRTRPFANAVNWLLSLATTPKRTMTTTEGENVQLVFEAEETNPFSEDRLVSNSALFILSVLINGVQTSLTAVFPRLHLPIPLMQCVRHLFAATTTGAAEEGSHQEKIDSVLPEIAAFMLPSTFDTQSRQKLAEKIFISATAEEIARSSSPRKQQQIIMPISDVIYQRLLVSKMLDLSPLFKVKLSEQLMMTTKKISGDITSDVFLVGDTAQLDTILLC